MRRFVLIVALATLVGACAGPRVSAGYAQTTWNDCDGPCRAQIVRDKCPAASEVDPNDPRLMKFVGTRDQFEAALIQRCEGNQAPRIQLTAWNSGNSRQPNSLLARKAMRVFGPAPTKHHTFDGVKRNFEPLGRRPCTERREHVAGGTMVRVVCNPGPQIRD